MHKPLVSIIIVNYNTFQLTCDCIESIRKFTVAIDYEIIIVDNNSTETPAKLFLEKYPFIKLVQNAVNSGFAAGNNLGIANSKGDIILLLNSDTYLQEDSISLTAKVLLDNPGFGVVGCKMTFPDGTAQHTARKFRSITWEILDLFRPILFFLNYQKRAKLMLGKYFHSDFDTECDWVNGAFFMFKRKMLDEFPQSKLDERFFMYGEDHLWCWQIKQRGFRNYFLSTTKIVHINNASTSYSKRLKLLRIMFQHELEIMKERKGKGLYYFLFKTVYGFKENIRFFAKNILLKVTGKLVS